MGVQCLAVARDAFKKLISVLVLNFYLAKRNLSKGKGGILKILCANFLFLLIWSRTIQVILSSY